MSEVVKVIELVGSSEQGWTEAAQAALDEASKTIKGITGLEVNDITAKVDPGRDKIILFLSAILCGHCRKELLKNSQKKITLRVNMDRGNTLFRSRTAIGVD